MTTAAEWLKRQQDPNTKTAAAVVAPSRRCRDCNGVISDVVIEGRHGMRVTASGGVPLFLNCIGKEIAP